MSKASNHGWTLSSSDEDDKSLLSSKKKKYRSPEKIKAEQKRKLKTNDCNPKRQKIEKKTVCNSANSSSQNPLDIWMASQPYNFLLTTVNGISPEYNHISQPLCSLGIKQILSPDFGDIQESVQFNYCIDMEWVIEQYPPHVRNKPMLVVHGEQGPSFAAMKQPAVPYPNIEFCRVDLPPFGTHHTKMMFLRYQEGIRIIILTANLVAKDWHQKTQGMWISPVFPLKTDSTVEKSETNFKNDLIFYLQHYPKHKTLLRWIDLIKSHDLSQVRVFLIASVPGRHTGGNLKKWGHTKLRTILSREIEKPKEDYEIIGQFSSIGSLGTDRHKWLCTEWLTSMSACKNTGMMRKQLKLKLVFPCVEDVRKSLEGYPAGTSIPYSKKTAVKQIWLENFFYKWRAGHVGRTEAAPHIKSYASVAPDNSSALWWLVTSANLSKAAWGGFEKKQTQLAIKSYELGVLFVPKYFDETKDKFSLNTGSQNSVTLPFSLPLEQYGETDQPWLWDASHKELPDRNGNMWCPC